MIHEDLKVLKMIMLLPQQRHEGPLDNPDPQIAQSGYGPLHLLCNESEGN